MDSFLSIWFPTHYLIILELVEFKHAAPEVSVLVSNRQRFCSSPLCICYWNFA